MIFMMNPPGFFEGDMKKTLKQIHTWLFQLNENLQYTLSHLDEENFVSSFSVPSGGGNEGLAEILKRLEALENASGGGEEPGEEDDSGETAGEWASITVRNMNATDTERLPCIRREGNLVFMAGGAYVKTSLASNGTLAVASLTAEYRPAEERVFPIISDKGVMQMSVSKLGAVKIKNLSGGSITTSQFISFCSVYAL